MSLTYFFLMLCVTYIFIVTLFVFLSFSEMSKREAGLALSRW